MASSELDGARIAQILWDLTDGDIGNRKDVDHLADQLVERGVRMDPLLAQKEMLTELIWQAEVNPELGFRVNCEALAGWLVEHGVAVLTDG